MFWGLVHLDIREVESQKRSAGHEMAKVIEGVDG